MKIRTPAEAVALAQGLAIDASPSGIEASERAGGAWIETAGVCPKDMTPDRAAFESVGFRFGDEYDEIFTRAELPDGWRLENVSPYHTKIIDSRSRDRGRFFYKAAFYDSRAYAALDVRYEVVAEWDDGPGDGEPEAVSIRDAGRPIIQAPLPVGVDPWDALHKAKDIMRAQLDAVAPHNKDRLAYWETPADLSQIDVEAVAAQIAAMAPVDD